MKSQKKNLSNVVILPYKVESNSATNLAQGLTTALGAAVRRLYTDERGKFNPKPRNIVVNWGCSSAPARFDGANILNRIDVVKVASNKLSTFEVLAGNPNVRIPEWTTEYDSALEMTNDSVVVCRTKLNGHSGAGIVLAAREEDVVQNCPLYTRYVKKASEFRVHVAFGSVIDVQIKRQRTEFNGEVNYAIRNHDNGWVYCRENIEEPTELRDMAVAAINALGLDFGAVDIIYNKHYNKCFVLEVNTAPGLEGTTVEKYVTAFMEYLNGKALV